MEERLKEQFFSVLLQFRRVGAAFPPECAFQMGELSVMRRVDGCCCDPGRNPSVSEICDTLQVSKPAVSQILNSLERKGYIVRQIDPADRRRISVAATPQGLMILQQSVRQYDQAMEALCARFGEAELCQLIQQLGRLNKVFEQMKDEWPGEA